MKHSLVLVLALCASLLPATAQQQLKIGTIDMERLFGSYFLTAEIRDELREQEQEVEMEVETMRVQLMEFYEQRESLIEQINSPELSPEIRDSLRSQLQSLQMEASALERQMREYMQENQRAMQEQGRRSMRSIFDDLNTAISDVSRREGYDLVFDKSGTSPQGVPFLLYTDEISDFTDLVIEVANEEAPEGFDPEAAFQGDSGLETSPSTDEAPSTEVTLEEAAEEAAAGESAE